MPDREIFCAGCDTEMFFEAPPCRDGHEDDCPELICTGCGTAILIAPLTVRALLRPVGPRIAPQQRRAA